MVNSPTSTLSWTSISNLTQHTPFINHTLSCPIFSLEPPSIYMYWQVTPHFKRSVTEKLVLPITGPPRPLTAATTGPEGGVGGRTRAKVQNYPHWLLGKLHLRRTDHLCSGVDRSCSMLGYIIACKPCAGRPGHCTCTRHAHYYSYGYSQSCYIEPATPYVIQLYWTMGQRIFIRSTPTVGEDINKHGSYLEHTSMEDCRQGERLQLLGLLPRSHITCSSKMMSNIWQYMLYSH